MSEQSKSEAFRIAEAYLRMAQIAKYRPRAPSDGFGGICLSDAELQDREILLKESVLYANDFIAEENTCKFWIGVSSYATNRAFVFAIEAARLLCSGSDDDRASKLLKMALAEIRKAEKYPST